MRLLLTLEAMVNTKYNTLYHNDVRGLIYGLSRGSEFNCHDDPGYRFFSFSNIFPSNGWNKGNIKRGSIWNIIISSPNVRFLSYMKEQFEYLKDIWIGNMGFRINYVSMLGVRLPNQPFSLITQTPIIINIKKYRYEESGCLENIKNDSACWQSDKPIGLFLTQLQNNLVKKYNTYHKSESSDGIKFTKFNFMRDTATPLDQNITRIGSRWEFIFPQSSPILQFAFDSGFGEHGSEGFGFMNLL